MPGPVGILSFDNGLEGVIDKYINQREYWIKEHDVPILTKQAAYINIWRKVESDYMSVLSEPGIRSVLIDTGSDLWELERLAEFGQLSPATDIKRAYVVVNQKYRSLIRAAYNTDKNVVFTHRVKKQYKREKMGEGKIQEVWTGEHDRSGFGETGFLIQVNIRHIFNGSDFGIRITNCRQNMTLCGFELWGEECNFATLAGLVFDMDPEEWK